MSVVAVFVIPLIERRAWMRCLAIGALYAFWPLFFLGPDGLIQQLSGAIVTMSLGLLLGWWSAKIFAQPDTQPLKPD